MKDFEIYNKGLCYCSVCSSLPKDEIVLRVNAENPTGLDHGWGIAKDNFREGPVNPSPCEQYPETHKHYLLSC